MSIPVSWFIQILNMSIGAAWAALLVMAGRMLLRRAPKFISYALWSVVLFRLVCPISFTSVLSLMPQPQTIPQEIIYAPQPEIESGFRFFDQAVNQSLPPATPAASANPVQLWLEIGSLVWQAGMVLMLAYCVISYLRFRGRLREAVLREGNVWESDRIPTAFVLGFLRPKIYLPLGLTEEERRYILCHEETHIRRKDHLIKPLALLLLCVHWFNPVLWAAYFLLCRDMEMSCDEAVMKTLGPDVRKGYSSSLLAVSQRQNGLVTPLAFGENDVKSRIQNVLRYKKPALWALAAAAALGLILAFCLISNPKGTEWVALSSQKGLTCPEPEEGERLLVERQGSGSVSLEDREQVKRLVELTAALEVGKEPLPAEERSADWELRFTFGQYDPATAESLALCFTKTQVWGETGSERGQCYPLRESSELFRMVEEYTFLLDPGEVGEYQVGFQEIREGQAGQYVLVTEPMVGSRLASLLLDGNLTEEKPGSIPPADNYLFINMGRPGTAYYLYEAGGRFFMERPEDYRLELTQETYGEIRNIWRTIAHREAPDETNGVYTGYEETVEGRRLRKFTYYQADVAPRLAELILTGKDVPLNPLEKVVPVDSFLRVEIREPGNAYYIYQEDGHYYAERLTDYRVELSWDAYQEIRNIYLDAAEDGIASEGLSFYADGHWNEIGRVGVQGYFEAFTAQNIPEELRIQSFTLGEITPMAVSADGNEFAVCFLWDYDTTEASRWISANGNGVPTEKGWHWTENYQEFRFRRTAGNLYTIVGIGTGGGGQGLEPISSSNTPATAAKNVLNQLLSCTQQQAEELDAALTQNFTTAIQSNEAGRMAGNGNVTDYLTKRFGSLMTGKCIEMIVANRTYYQVVKVTNSRGADIQAQGLQLTRRAGDKEVYDFSAELRTAGGDLAATAQGNLTMEQEGDGWKASQVTVTVTEAVAPAGETAADPLARFKVENIPNAFSNDNFDTADALRDYLLENLTEEQYSVISCQRDAIGGYPYLMVQIVVPDKAPIEPLLAAYTGEPVPVEIQMVPFSWAQLKKAEADINAFLRENPEIKVYRTSPFYNEVPVQVPEDNQKLRDFIEAYPVKDIFRVSVYPDGPPLNPD